MPARLVNEDGKCAAIWGEHGHKYFYTCGDKTAQKEALQKAIDQGIAAHMNGYKGAI